MTLNQRWSNMVSRYCYFESIEDKFNFGKHQGLSLADVMDFNPSYVKWCLEKCDGVLVIISHEALSQIQDAYPELPLGSDLIGLCEKRLQERPSAIETTDEPYVDYGHNESPTYDRYRGTWAQDVEGYSDDDIDTIFDGEPDAYWNID